MQSPAPLVGAPSAGATASTTPRRPLPAHTWAGDAACYLPRPAQPPTIAGTTPKPGHGGTWLRASAPARLRIVAGARDGGAAAALELSLPKQLLLRRDLPAADGCCRGGAGSDGSGALGTAWQAPRILEELGVLLIPQARGGVGRRPPGRRPARPSSLQARRHSGTPGHSAPPLRPPPPGHSHVCVPFLRHPGVRHLPVQHGPAQVRGGARAARLGARRLGCGCRQPVGGGWARWRAPPWRCGRRRDWRPCWGCGRRRRQWRSKRRPDKGRDQENPF